MFTNMSAFPAVLDFPQWKSDLLCYEVATVLHRKGTNEMLLAKLGAVLSVAGKQILREEQCKLKRFLQNATDDFKIDSTRGLEVVVFIGCSERLVAPANVPETEVAAMALLAQLAPAAASMSPREAAVERTAETMHAEIASILSQRADQTLLISQVGARLCPQARQWLRKAHVKLQVFLEQHVDVYVVDATVGSETVTMRSAAEPIEFPSSTRKMSIASEASTASTCATTVDCAATVIELLRYQPNLVALLTAAMPEVYEE